MLTRYDKCTCHIVQSGIPALCIRNNNFHINTRFLKKQHFCKQRHTKDVYLSCSTLFQVSLARLKLAKNQAKAMQHPEGEHLLFKNYSFFSFALSTKNNRRYCKNCTKNKYICLNEVRWLMTLKTRLKMKHRSLRHSINRHGHKYDKYIMCLSIIMVTCIKKARN